MYNAAILKERNWDTMNGNDAFFMGGCVARSLGFDLAHTIGNQLAAQECYARPKPPQKPPRTTVKKEAREHKKP